MMFIYKIMEEKGCMSLCIYYVTLAANDDTTYTQCL